MAKPAQVKDWTSGFCNPYTPFDKHAHERCLVVAGDLVCACRCHRHYATFWVGWDDEPQMQAGWANREDAELFLSALRIHGLIDQEAATSVDEYVGDCPW